MRVAPPTNRPISCRREDVGFSGDISLRKSGIRNLGISSEIHGVGVLDSGVVFGGAPVACFRAGFRRKRGPKTGQWRRPAGGRVLESFRPQIGRFRVDAKMWDFPETFPQKFMALVYRILASCSVAPPSHVSERVSGENGVRKWASGVDRRGAAFWSRPAHKSPDFGPT